MFTSVLVYMVLGYIGWILYRTKPPLKVFSILLSLVCFTLMHKTLWTDSLQARFAVDTSILDAVYIGVSIIIPAIAGVLTVGLLNTLSKMKAYTLLRVLAFTVYGILFLGFEYYLVGLYYSFWMVISFISLAIAYPIVVFAYLLPETSDCNGILVFANKNKKTFVLLGYVLYLVGIFITAFTILFRVIAQN